MPEKPIVPHDSLPVRSAPRPVADNRPEVVVPQAQSSARRKKKDEHPRDTPREIAETVVFVVVLVLMLKTFVAEAFVIPTGSMATTLLGYHRMVECPQCGYKFPANCSSEVDPQQGRRPERIVGCICPNCQYPILWNPDRTAPSWSSGDRVLVAKFLYDRDYLWHPHRHEVIVFKYPREPQQHATSINYIKRCEGLAGETIVIFDGNLYVTRSLTYDGKPRPDDPLDLWEHEYTYENDESAINLFVDSMQRRAEGKSQDGDFDIVRDPPDVMLAKRRIVFAADHQPRDVTAAGIVRWRFAGDGWAGDDPAKPTIFTHKAGSAAIDWMTYAHVMGEELRVGTMTKDGELRKALEPHDLFNAPNFKSQSGRRLIDNMLGYNSDLHETRGINEHATGSYWVSDLMLEAEVTVDSQDGEFVMELSKGMDRFRASFDIASGECTLLRRAGLTDADRDSHQTVLDKKPCKLKGKGSYRVRFANFDERLTVWVSSTGWLAQSELPFGDGVVYSSNKDRGPFKENDLDAPAQVGARSAGVQVSHLSLWRNTYYTLLQELGRNPAEATILGQPQRLLTYYVQPGHYLALGDNSASSADSRDWGLVPDRLLLGRALAVYFPFWPFEQRVGLIK